MGTYTLCEVKIDFRSNSMKKQRIELTVNAASIELGVARETITRGLKSAGIKTKRSYTLKEIVLAVHGDIKGERLRLIRAKADHAEITVAEARENLMPTVDVQAVFNRIMAHVRAQFLGLPSAAHACNHDNPKEAHAALTEYCDNALRACRDFKL